MTLSNGDVQCGLCFLDTTSDEHYLECHGVCRKRFHKLCTNLSDERFSHFSSDRRRKWVCNWCVQCHELNKPENNLPIEDITHLLPGFDVVPNDFAPNSLFSSLESWKQFEENVNNTYSTIPFFKKNLFNAV